MADCRTPDPPSPFVADWVDRLAPTSRDSRRALDVAMGGGRHAVLLATAGFRVFGVDRRFDAVRDTVHLASARALTVRAWCADLTATTLPRRYFDLVVVTRYLQRGLFAALADTLRPGGTVLYETFTTHQRARGTGPTSPDHLLQPGELKAAFTSLDVRLYEEVDVPDAVARLVATRRR